MFRIPSPLGKRRKDETSWVMIHVTLQMRGQFDDSEYQMYPPSDNRNLAIISDDSLSPCQDAIESNQVPQVNSVLSFYSYYFTLHATPRLDIPALDCTAPLHSSTTPISNPFL